MNIENLISNVGFPIAMCLIIYLDLRRITVEIRDELKKLNKT